MTSNETLWITLLNHEAFSVENRVLSSSWVYALACSGMVGLSGLFPIFVLSAASSAKNSVLRFMLSFACGGLLGDVFLHLLPEAYDRLHKRVAANHETDIHDEHMKLGLWILLGILTFIVIEMMCNSDSQQKSQITCNNNNEDEVKSIKVSGYLNLLANCIDNFAHGLAVGGGFLVDNKTGFITTTCILCHEIPHEIGDFAILMNSGFSVYDAAWAQFSTALLGILGAFTALALNSFMAVESYTCWIIPFTSGGFLHISLVTVLPDLMKSDSSVDVLRVLSGIALGISTMMAVSQL